MQEKQKIRIRLVNTEIMSVDAGRYCHLPITLSPSTLASTATFPLLGHPAVESTSFVNFSPGLLKAHSGGIQMLFFFCLAQNKEQDEPI